MKSQRSFISVVDDDESIRESLPDLLKQMSYAVRTFSSAADFLASEGIDETDCLILDIAMPGMTGPELQLELKMLQREIPIIFITAQRDEALRSRLMELGAVECLLKPFSETDLTAALDAVFKVD